LVTLSNWVCRLVNLLFRVTASEFDERHRYRNTMIRITPTTVRTIFRKLMMDPPVIFWCKITRYHG
jgi:hypothetical protein